MYYYSYIYIMVIMIPIATSNTSRYRYQHPCVCCPRQAPACRRCWYWLFHRRRCRRCRFLRFVWGQTKPRKPRNVTWSFVWGSQTNKQEARSVKKVREPLSPANKAELSSSARRMFILFLRPASFLHATCDMTCSETRPGLQSAMTIHDLQPECMYYRS